MFELDDGALTKTLCEIVRIGVNERDANHKLEIQLMAGVAGLFGPRTGLPIRSGLTLPAPLKPAASDENSMIL
jgi:hypothetical protein